MSVKAIRPGYHGDMKDTVDKFHGKHLLAIGWDRHLMYATPLCIPVPPQMPFSTLVEDVLPTLYGQHPQFAEINWTAVRWTRSGEPFDPRFDKSLFDNGLGHKALLRFSTPTAEQLQVA